MTRLRSLANAALQSEVAALNYALSLARMRIQELEGALTSQPEEQRIAQIRANWQGLKEVVRGASQEPLLLASDPFHGSYVRCIDEALASQPEGWQPIAEKIAKLAHWEVGDNLQALRTRLACIGAALKALPPAPHPVKPPKNFSPPHPPNCSCSACDDMRLAFDMFRSKP